MTSVLNLTIFLEMKQQRSVRKSKKKIELQCLSLEKKLNIMLKYGDIIEESEENHNNEEEHVASVDSLVVDNLRLSTKLEKRKEEASLAISGV